MSKASGSRSKAQAGSGGVIDSVVFEGISAVAVGDMEGLQKAISRGFNVNAADYDGRTALHLAATNGHTAMVKELLKLGADAKALDKSGLMPVQNAMDGGFKELARILGQASNIETKTALWQSENDCAKFLLYHNILGVKNVVSNTVYGDMALNKDRKADFDLFFENLRERGAQIVSIQDIIVCDCSLPEFDSFMMDLIQCETEDKTITTQRGTDNSVMARSYTISPIMDLLSSNLQICTPKGVVMANQTTEPQKVRILSQVFIRMGLPIILKLPHPLKLSGGDYIPAGPDLCFMGTGIATDSASIRYMMQKDAFGSRRVAVVRDLFDRSAERRHLDSVFKIIDKDVIIILDSIIGEDNCKRRLVNEYAMCPKLKKYVLTRMNIELSKYVQDQGFHVIKMPESLYNDHMGIINFGAGDLLVNNPSLAKLITSDKHFKGKVQVDTFSCSSEMYKWLYKTTLIFRQTTPACQHAMPPPTETVRAWTTIKDGKIHQTTDKILMVAPVGFQTNAETAQDNYFMKKGELTPAQIEKKALVEFSYVVAELMKAGVKPVIYVAERWYNTPDAVFPNNWFSTHAATEFKSAESTVMFYPMKTPSRRKERREYIISELQEVYDRELSLAQWENSDFPHFLESTGALIMDRKRRIAYVALSQRAYRKICETWASRMGYTLVMFHATDAQGNLIYHSNVMMSVGTTVAVVCVESIEDMTERQHLLTTLGESHEIISITRDQMNSLCGNVLEVHGEPYTKRLMCMSTRSYNAFTAEQKEAMLRHVDQLLHADITTIEDIGGGGIRCMMGELF